MGYGNNIVNLNLGAVGWDHDRWCGEFYPDDLPREWRLTYYANEYRTVLIPEVYWLDRNISEFLKWYEDVPENFRFYLFFRSALTGLSKRSNISQSVQSLKEKLGGFIIHRHDCPRDPTFAQIRAWCPEAKLFGLSDLLEPEVLRYWHGLSERAFEDIGVAQFSGELELKPLRNLIERFVKVSERGECILFIDGEFSILRTATAIAHLLGF